MNKRFVSVAVLAAAISTPTVAQMSALGEVNWHRRNTLSSGQRASLEERGSVNSVHLLALVKP